MEDLDMKFSALESVKSTAEDLMKQAGENINNDSVQGECVCGGWKGLHL